MRDQGSDNRKFIRFNSDPGATAEIDLFLDRPRGEFEVSIPALILNESFRGCGLIVIHTDKLQIGDRCRVKVGKVQPLMAQVKWRAQIDAQVLKIGFEFLE